MVAESGSPPAADSEERSRRVPSWLLVFAAFLGSVVGVIVARLVLVGFAGEFDYARKTVWDYSFAGKTVWMYLDVFLVPAAVAVATFWFTSQQNRRQREAEDAQEQIAMAAEEQRAQDEALQVYLDRMSELLIYQRLHDHRNEYDAERVTARARTLAVLRSLDGVRKRTVLLFLREARLINRNVVPHYDARYVGLDDADLSKADLRGARLVSTSKEEFISLKNTNLKCAKLSEAMLYGADLSGADLSGADLSGADLRGADLSEAKLNGAILNRAQLGTARVSVVLPDGGAEPSEPYPAGLRQADLSQANLQWAQGWTYEQLDQAESLEGATMPDGKQYEVWVKRGWLRQRSRKGHREDGENGGPS
jgi:uncharacterized protein YjbI with pentapeptide repeats